LRHDLDCHGEASTIAIAIVRADGAVRVRVENAVRAGANPGNGLGLPQTEARLRLAWGDLATLKTGPHDGRFIAELTLPMVDEERAA